MPDADVSLRHSLPLSEQFVTLSAVSNLLNAFETSDVYDGDTFCKLASQS